MGLRCGYHWVKSGGPPGKDWLRCAEWCPADLAQPWLVQLGVDTLAIAAGLRLRGDPACGEGTPLQAFPCALRCLGRQYPLPRDLSQRALTRLRPQMDPAVQAGQERRRQARPRRRGRAPEPVVTGYLVGVDSTGANPNGKGSSNAACTSAVRSRRCVENLTMHEWGG
jgi:hypothetical protein